MSEEKVFTFPSLNITTNWACKRLNFHVKYITIFVCKLKKKRFGYYKSHCCINQVCTFPHVSLLTEINHWKSLLPHIKFHQLRSHLGAATRLFGYMSSRLTENHKHFDCLPQTFH